MPRAARQTNTDFYSYTFQSGKYVGQAKHTLLATDFQNSVGTLTSASI